MNKNALTYPTQGPENIVIGMLTHHMIQLKGVLIAVLLRNMKTLESNFNGTRCIVEDEIQLLLYLKVPSEKKRAISSFCKE